MNTSANPPVAHRKSGADIAARLRQWGPLAALVILFVGFSIVEPTFASWQNLQTIANRSAIPLILAIGMTFIILQGSIDLSVEGVMAISSLSIAMVVLNNRTGLDFGLFGIGVGVAVGAGFGFLSGFIVTRLRVPSFMVTLGIWSISLGTAMLISGGAPPIIKDQLLRTLGLGYFLGIPNLFII